MSERKTLFPLHIDNPDATSGLEAEPCALCGALPVDQAVRPDGELLAKAHELDRIAEYCGEVGDPFAAWETIALWKLDAERVPALRQQLAELRTLLAGETSARRAAEATARMAYEQNGGETAARDALNNLLDAARAEGGAGEGAAEPDVEGLVERLREIEGTSRTILRGQPINRDGVEAAGSLLSLSRLLDEVTRERDGALEAEQEAQASADTWLAAHKLSAARAETAERLLEESERALRELHAEDGNAILGMKLAGEVLEAISKVSEEGFSSSQGCRDDLCADRSGLTAGAVSPVWRCFHCDDVFTDERCARLHFGATEASEPACKIKAGAEGSLLEALRRTEAELADAWHAIHTEGTEAAQAYYAQQSRHQTQLSIAEELGYERGLADGRKYPADPTPTSQEAGHE